MFASSAVRAAAKLWYVKMLADQQTVPVPHDAQEVVTGADDPDRVLLIGNGPTHGWGTVTHELALTGQLARTLTLRTGRATDVRYIGSETMNLATALPWLGEEPLGDHDLVLLVLSMNDAVRLTPVDGYRADMERLLGTLAAGTKPSARIVVAGIHAVDSLPHYRGLPARVGQRHANRLNAAVREVVGRFDGVQFLELQAPAAEPGRPYGSPHLYAEWAEGFADACAPALDVARLLDADRAAVPDRERKWAWEPARRILAEEPKEGYPDLERLVHEAKEKLGVDAAYVSLVDGDRQFYVANTGPVGSSVPLELSHCRVTFAGDDVLVVGNSMKDERFRDNALIDLTQLRFYAGVPLKNESGENVGTFCVTSFRAGAEDTVSETQLRLLASRAQEAIQRLAAEGAAADADADGEHDSTDASRR